MYNSHTDIWIAGAFAAITVDFVVFPFDTLKTRIQSPNYEQVFKDARTGAVKRNVLFRGLYQGVWSVVFSTIPASGAFFTTYEGVKYAFFNSSSDQGPESPSQSQHSRSTLRLPFTHSLPTPIIHAIASSSAEMVSCLLLTPAEVIKQNAQMVNSNMHTKNNTSAMRQVISRFKSHPWRLWSGYTALVGRNLPFTGLQFPMFEFFRERLTDWRRERKGQRERSGVDDRKSSSRQREALIERAGITAASAAVAGTIASFFTTPVDVVKTRVMLSAATDISGQASEPRAHIDGAEGSSTRKGEKGAYKIGKEIFRKEGVKGLFKGGAIRSLWTAISMSLYLSMYESGRMVLENRRKKIEGIEKDGEVVI